LNEEQSQAFFKQALDLGINFWDTGSIRRVAVTSFTRE
jgi:aryl-alcohol dehydrogenase-like predicted oxidoreductase